MLNFQRPFGENVGLRMIVVDYESKDTERAEPDAPRSPPGCP
jgi:hypothetical protein